MKRPLRIIVKLAALAALFVATAGLGSMAYFHYGDPRDTCASCHEMKGIHTAWSSSAHASVHCRNCHGGSLTLDVHALRGHINRVVQHFTGHADDPIHLTERDLLDLHRACQACHAQALAEWQSSRHAVTYADIFLDAEHNKKEQIAADCLRCHGMFFQGSVEDLVGPLDVKGPWKMKDAAQGGKAVIPCLACHQVHTPAGTSGSGQLYVRREETHFADTRLPETPMWQGRRAVKVSSDPRQRLCVQCHASDAFRQVGTSDDRTPVGVHEGLSCFDCHRAHSQSAKASCTACHPANSHCGIDVEEMDTTFKSATSKHNIHSVGCGDCHEGRRPERKPKR